MLHCNPPAVLSFHSQPLSVSQALPDTQATRGPKKQDDAGRSSKQPQQWLRPQKKCCNHKTNPGYLESQKEHLKLTSMRDEIKTQKHKPGKVETIPGSQISE